MNVRQRVSIRVGAASAAITITGASSQMNPLLLDRNAR